MAADNFSSLLTELKTTISTLTNPTQVIEARNVFIKKNLTPLYENLKKISNEEKSSYGQKINVFKTQIFELTNAKISELEKILENSSNIVDYDINLNTADFAIGAINPISIVIDRIAKYFKSLNFTIQSGEEVLGVKYAFDHLNVPEFHPTRDTSETFYVSKDTVLRQQNTSSSAAFIDQNKDDDIRIMNYGNVYRNDDDDASHSHQFNQIDFVWIKKGLNVRNLKWVVNGFLKAMYGNNIKTRYRLSNFPFTEPSFEVDVSCPFCGQKGCSVCKKTGWIEILGAGMFNQQVLEKAGIKGKNGIAAGLGIERIAMLKYGISDVRDLYSNNFKILKQFMRREDK